MASASGIFKISVQDSRGNTAPTIYIHKSELDGETGGGKKEDPRRVAIRIAKKRSRLGDLPGWMFR